MVVQMDFNGSSSSSSGNNVGGGGSGSGYAHSGTPGTHGRQAPNFNFETFLASYFDSLRKYHEDFSSRKPRIISYAYSHNSPQASAQAQSSLTYRNGLQHQIQQNTQNAAAGYGFPGGFPAFAGFPPTGFPAAGAASGQGFGAGFGQGFGPNGFGTSFGGSFGGPGSGGAGASASIGPEGVHQTAGVFPENPHNPNVDTRFGGSEGGAPSDSGYHSVFTSSVSGSSNVDGKPSSFHQASTTVNDNGKVTTFTVRNP